MELRQLRYVVAVADELHFGRAAAREHITASALSQQVARLERELGVTLFDRQPRRVAVTVAGAAFLEHARQSLASAALAGITARAAAGALSGTLTVGFTSHGAGPLMTPLLREFRSLHPHVELRVRELDFLQHFTALDTRGADAVFVRGPFVPTPPLHRAELTSEARVVAIPLGHRLAVGDGPLGAADLAQETFFRLPAGVPDDWAAHFAPWGSPPSAPVLGTVSEVLSLVAAGAGVALLPASLASVMPRSDLRYRPADVDHSTLGIAWRPGAASDAFAELAQELAPHHLPATDRRPAGIT